MSVDDYLAQQAPILTPEEVGRYLVELASSPERAAGAYLIGPKGLVPLA
jgi:hypothetical protein